MQCRCRVGWREGYPDQWLVNQDAGPRSFLETTIPSLNSRSTDRFDLPPASRAEQINLRHFYCIHWVMRMEVWKRGCEISCVVIYFTLWTPKSIRRQDTNNYSDTEARALSWAVLCCVICISRIDAFEGCNTVVLGYWVKAFFGFTSMIPVLRHFPINFQNEILAVAPPLWGMQESESKFLTVRQWVLTQGWRGGESLVMASKKAVKGANWR